MQKISSGIKSFDRLIDFFYIGDNVVWEVDSGAPYKVFLQNFIRQAFDDSQKIIYISFNRSPQSILKAILNSPAECSEILNMRGGTNTSANSYKLLAL